MATLQRSTVSFRREGSSGLVWDEKYLSEELYQMLQNENGKADYRELRPSQSTTAIRTIDRIDSDATPPCPRSLSSFTINELPSEGRFLKRLSGVLGKDKKSKPTTNQP